MARSAPSAHIFSAVGIQMKYLDLIYIKLWIPQMFDGETGQIRPYFTQVL